MSTPIHTRTSGITSAGWLVSPRFDGLLIANLFWPLVVFLIYLLPEATSSLSFIQIYLISTPHRWITLILVFLDQKNFKEAPGRFIGVGFSLIVTGLVLATLGGIFPHPADPGNPLVYAMAVDYIWNSWHFAAQHAGIARIYGRKTGRVLSIKDVRIEKAILRLLVLWTFIRIITRLKPESVVIPLINFLSVLDALAFLPALWLLVVEYRKGTSLSRFLYILSVASLYGALLLGVNFAGDGTLRGLYIAQAVFHAVEYLAIVGWTMNRQAPEGVWRFMAPRAALTVATFVLIVGFSNYAIASVSTYSWLLLTLLVSLLHYGYDGMIWKAPKKTQAHSK